MNQEVVGLFTAYFHLMIGVEFHFSKGLNHYNLDLVGWKRNSSLLVISSVLENKCLKEETNLEQQMLDISLNLFPEVAVLKIWFGNLWGSLRFFRGCARSKLFS